MNENPNKEHDFSAHIGAQLVEKLESAGCLVAKMLFIDNYNPSPPEFTLDVNRYQNRLQQAGFSPDIVTFEATLELPAKNLLLSLEENTHRRDGRVYLNHQDVLLMDYGRPTCSLLDAALYIAKLSLFELAITILQSSYKEQQRKVRRVLRALGYTHLPIVNVYFGEDRQITVGVQS